MSNLHPFCMPKWGIEMSEGTVAEWMVTEGHAFKKGDLLCLIETDKITNEVEAERDGVIHRILVPAGGEAEAVGTLLAVIGQESDRSEEVDDFVANFVAANTSGSAVKRKSSAKAQDAKPTPKDIASRPRIETNRPISPKALELAELENVDLADVEGSGREGRITLQDVEQAIRPARRTTYSGPVDSPEEDRSIFASPLARRIAAQNGIDLGKVSGSGARGRISKKDVEALLASQAGNAGRSAPFRMVSNNASVEPFDKIRKIIARRLTAAKQDIPHFYLRSSAQVDALLELRKTANLVLGIKASVTDYLVLASAKALAQHPDVNVQVHGDERHLFPHADVAVAVATPSGLVTPILRQADRMRIDQVAEGTKALVGKAREGRLSYDELDGGTFTISNLGMYGIEGFDAVINPPQGAILAVGKSMRVPAETVDGEIMFETRINLTLSLDHRAIDGSVGAEFLATLVALLEQPEQLFT